MKLSSSTQELAKQEFINLKQSCYANLFHFPLVCIFTDCMLSDAVVAAASITLIDNSGSLSKKLVLDSLRHTPIKVKTNTVICQEGSNCKCEMGRTSEGHRFGANFNLAYMHTGFN